MTLHSAPFGQDIFFQAHLKMNQHFAVPSLFGDDDTSYSSTKRPVSITKTAGTRHGRLTDAPWKKSSRPNLYRNICMTTAVTIIT